MPTKAEKNQLKATTALQRPKNFNAQLLEALLGDEAREKTAQGVIVKTDNAADQQRWDAIKKGKQAMTVAELAEIMRAMEAKGQKINREKLEDEKRKSAMRDQAFYDALAQNILTEEKIKAELDALREEEKKQAGWVSKAFSTFSDRDPVAKAMQSPENLEKYFYKNGITYNTQQGKFVQGTKPRTKWDTVWDNRFLIAAGLGAAVGFAGLNLAALPILSAAPGLFFGALPWLAAPFIGLNVYKSFSHYSVTKEWKTLAGFLAITSAGLGIAALVTSGMTAILPVVDPASFASAAIPGLTSGGFSPMQWMLPIIGAFAGAAVMRKRAEAVVDGKADDPAKWHMGPASDKKGWKGTLARGFNKVAGLVVNERVGKVYNALASVFINKYTAPAIKAAGAFMEKGTELINNVFPKFIDIVGIPAVATLLSLTMATGGLGLLGAFAGYYATAFVGMGVGLAAMVGAYAAFGARGKDFRELAKAAAAGFSISSSSATMPTEKEVLKKMGVSENTRNTVVPLGGVFNMYGTSLYMGLTAFYALSMFGATPSAAQYAQTAATVIGIALGAPGIPASNITLLDPVLRQTGLATADINKVYTMILPADRILDMTQTALNVLGDMLPAVQQDTHKMRYNRVKNIKKIREDRLAAFKAAADKATEGMQSSAALNDNKQDVTAPATTNDNAAAVPAPAAKPLTPAA